MTAAASGTHAHLRRERGRSHGRSSPSSGMKASPITTDTTVAVAAR
ncbi:hypothetical protein ACFQYP_43460 [Nonomuraea antimicrobica]